MAVASRHELNSTALRMKSTESDTDEDRVEDIGSGGCSGDNVADELNDRDDVDVGDVGLLDNGNSNRSAGGWGAVFDMAPVSTTTGAFTDSMKAFSSNSLR